jgi:hypothetical protein
MTNESALDRLLGRLTYVPELMREPGIRTQATNDADTKLFTDALNEVKALRKNNQIMTNALAEISDLGSSAEDINITEVGGQMLFAALFALAQVQS